MGWFGGNDNKADIYIFYDSKPANGYAYYGGEVSRSCFPRISAILRHLLSLTSSISSYSYLLYFRWLRDVFAW